MKQENNLKLADSKRKSVQRPATPTPLVKRAKKIKSIADAENLLASIISQFQRGKISDKAAKNLCYLLQTYAQLRKQAKLEDDLDRTIEIKMRTFIGEYMIVLDELYMRIKEELKLSEEQIINIKNKYKPDVSDERLKKLKQEVISAVNERRGKLTCLMDSTDIEDIKGLIIYSIRLMPEVERYRFIELLTERIYNN